MCNDYLSNIKINKSLTGLISTSKPQIPILTSLLVIELKFCANKGICGLHCTCFVSFFNDPYSPFENFQFFSSSIISDCKKSLKGSGDWGGGWGHPFTFSLY